MHWMQANNPQAMSNALWAYATLRYDPGPQLMEAATLQLMDKLDLFNPQVAPHAPSSTLNPPTLRCWIQRLGLVPVQVALLGTACRSLKEAPAYLGLFVSMCGDAARAAKQPLQGQRMTGHCQRLCRGIP